MRTFARLVVSALAVVGSASAYNIALNAIASSCSTNTSVSTNLCTMSPISPYTFVAANAVDGNVATEWVANGATPNPYLLINLGAAYTTVLNVQVEGFGNTGFNSAFNVYVGGSGTNFTSLATMESSMFQVLNVPNQVDVSANVGLSNYWTDTSTGATAGTPIQYVLYVAIADTANASASCASTGSCPGAPGDGQDDAFVNEIIVNPTPEPATTGLVGLTLLALGFVRRRRK